MLSYHLWDHSIYCLPRVPNILDWTLGGGDALSSKAVCVKHGFQAYSGVQYGEKRRHLHVTDSCAKTFIIPVEQKIDYYHTIFRIMSILAGSLWSYNSLAG
jgi:hypothetical protein